MKKEHIPTKTEKDYQRRVNAKIPRSNALGQCLRAFVSGGAICCMAQLIHDIAQFNLGLGEAEVSAFTAIVLVFIGATLTGLGVYDKIGAWAGAGSVVPITGFANSIVSPAMEFRREGYILGLGAKLFSIAGPVLVYGISASVLAGIITCCVTGNF